VFKPSRGFNSEFKMKGANVLITWHSTISTVEISPSLWTQEFVLRRSSCCRSMSYKPVVVVITLHCQSEWGLYIPGGKSVVSRFSSPLTRANWESIEEVTSLVSPDEASAVVTSLDGSEGKKEPLASKQWYVSWFWTTSWCLELSVSFCNRCS